MGEEDYIEGLRDAELSSIEDLFGSREENTRKEFVFFDENGNVVDEDSDKKVRAAVTELNELGYIVSESFIEIEKPDDKVKG